MKIQFTINAEEKQKILKDFLLLNLFNGKKFSHDQIEIETSTDSSNQSIPEISIFDNLNLETCSVAITFPNGEPTITNCTDRWNGTSADGYEPRFVRRWLDDKLFSCYVFRDNHERLAKKVVTEKEAFDFVKQAPRLS